MQITPADFLKFCTRFGKRTNRRKKTYKKSVPASDMLNPYVILAVIVKNADGRREISLNELLTAPKNIGKVYNLDSITMLDVLYRIEKLGLIKINRTAGLDVITIQEELAEQVIMFVMQKDWNYAEPVMNDRVGQRYHLDKISETLTRLN